MKSKQKNFQALAEFFGQIPIKIECHADLAHLVERDLAKVEVAGSSPVIRSKNKKEMRSISFLFFAVEIDSNPSNLLR